MERPPGILPSASSHGSGKTDEKNQEKDEVKRPSESEVEKTSPRCTESNISRPGEQSADVKFADEMPDEVRSGSGPRAEVAATTLAMDYVQNVTLSETEKEAVSFQGESGFSGVVEWLGPKLDDFLTWRCKTVPTGRIFPLPTSGLVLAALYPDCPQDAVSLLCMLVKGLNSLNGEGMTGSTTVTPCQRRCLDFLVGECKRVALWPKGDGNCSWDSFFKIKAIDYKGEEVLTAQPIQWENAAPALPVEVGSVDLASVCELGCKHYVNNFREYLVPVDDQVRVKGPKVMVAPEHWESLARGLIDRGICKAIHEDEIYRVQG